MAFNGLTALLDVIIPLFQRFAIGNFIETGELEGFTAFVLAYLGVIILQSLLVIGFGRMSMYLEMYLGRDMRRELFEHLQKLSLSFYNVTRVSR